MAILSYPALLSLDGKCFYNNTLGRHSLLGPSSVPLQVLPGLAMGTRDRALLP